MSKLEKTSWNAVELEQLSDKLTRQMISGDNATISQLVLKRGATVPRHSHINEQYSWIISGKLKFIFDDREMVLGAGEILLIPANTPHMYHRVDGSVSYLEVRFVTAPPGGAGK